MYIFKVISKIIEYNFLNKHPMLANWNCQKIWDAGKGEGVTSIKISPLLSKKVATKRTNKC